MDPIGDIHLRLHRFCDFLFRLHTPIDVPSTPRVWMRESKGDGWDFIGWNLERASTHEFKSEYLFRFDVNKKNIELLH